MSARTMHYRVARTSLMEPVALEEQRRQENTGSEQHLHPALEALLDAPGFDDGHEERAGNAAGNRASAAVERTTADDHRGDGGELQSGTDSRITDREAGE